MNKGFADLFVSMRKLFIISDIDFTLQLIVPFLSASPLHRLSQRERQCKPLIWIRLFGTGSGRTPRREARRI
jgi:hypothetical protein